MTFNSGLVLGDESGQEKNNTFEAPLSTKGGTLPSWKSSSYRVPLFTLSCLFQVALHLSKYASYTNSGASHGFVVESPLAYKSLLSIAPAPYYTHKYTSHHHTAWVTKALHWHLPVTVESLACRPAWWLNRAVELSQSSWSFQVSTFHTVTMLENLKKTCSNSTCRSLERFQLKILKSRFGCGLKESSVNKCVRRCISDWLKKTTNNTNPCRLPGIWGTPQFIQINSKREKTNDIWTVLVKPIPQSRWRSKKSKYKLTAT